MDKKIERELRDDIKKINEKLSDIKSAIATLKAKQNVGTWIGQIIFTVIIVGIGGIITTHFPK